MAATARRTILQSDAVSELVDELQLLGTGSDAGEAWSAVWRAVSIARVLRQRQEKAKAEAERIVDALHHVSVESPIERLRAAAEALGVEL